MSGKPKQDGEIPLPTEPTSSADADARIPARFIALMALMTSLVALSIDAMLPALGQIAADLDVRDANDRQLVLSMLFLGMVFGQIIYGPVSDAVGRRRPVFFGTVLFVVGTALSGLAESYPLMLFGRFIQGVGAAGPRIVIMAIIRDRYQGPAMARVMSLIMTVFIIIPALAPAMGQAMLWFGSWRLIFAMFAVLALIGLTWFWIAQPETLPPERRVRVTPRHLWRATCEVMTHPVSLGYTVTAGLVFAAFLGFLNSAQQILQEQYSLAEQFPLYFALLALSIGASTLTNSMLVRHFSISKLCHWSLVLGIAMAGSLLAASLAFAGSPPLWLLMTLLMMLFYVIGILFGNMNAMAMEPMGHIAGLASAVIASVATFMSMTIGGLVGALYDGTTIPLAAGYTILSVLALCAATLTERARAGIEEDS
ncbi:MAG: multidrug effflux MFS transporter [Pseudomonadota bacterium]